MLPKRCACYPNLLGNASWVYLLGTHACVLGYCLYLLDNIHFTHVTQEVYMSPKRYTCHPRGIYLLGIPLAHTSWVTCIPLALHHTVCYPRGMHAPKRYGLPEMQSKRYTQEVYPRGIYLLGCMHTSWVYLLGCSHTSWVAYLLGIPLGLHHTSWVAGGFTDVN